MDLFGEALLGYASGDRSTFYLIEGASDKHTYSLAERFRSYSKLNKVEKKLIALSYGQILDIGCGTGNVIPALEKKGKVRGIDISPKVVAVARQRGCNKCVVADIFKYLPKQKFDTITLFGNDLGLGGTVRKTKKLLEVLKSLLKNDGQILAITRNYTHGDFKEMTLTPVWKKKTGPSFGWIIFNIYFLSDLIEKQGLNSEIISTNSSYRLVRITKK